MIDLDEDLLLTDKQGREQGHMQVKIDLCDAKGVVLPEDEADDAFVDAPEDLLCVACAELRQSYTYTRTHARTYTCTWSLRTK